MKVGIFLSCTVMVQLTFDDAEQAGVVSDHLARAAPHGMDVSHDGGTVTVLRIFATENKAEEWAREIREGMDEGCLFNLEIGGVNEAARH
jgi:hypothetical protein